jgi:hypothetical protein
MKDYITDFKKQLIGFLGTGIKEENFIFYVIYKDDVKKFIVDFNTNKFGTVVDKVLDYCLRMAHDNNCDLEDLILTTKGDLIVI